MFIMPYWRVMHLLHVSSKVDQPRKIKNIVQLAPMSPIFPYVTFTPFFKFHEGNIWFGVLSFHFWRESTWREDDEKSTWCRPPYINEIHCRQSHCLSCSVYWHLPLNLEKILDKSSDILGGTWISNFLFFVI